MKKIVGLCLLMAVASFSFGQETFTSKQEALNFLKKTFSASFIKTGVYGKYDGKKFNDYKYYYDYELTDTSLKIYRKYGDEPDDWFQKNHTWAEMQFGDINSVKASEKSEDFRKLTGLTLKSRYAKFQSGYGRTPEKRTATSSSYSETFPFEIKKDTTIIKSIINAINAIYREDKAAAEAARKK
jgi:hypothetical protein